MKQWNNYVAREGDLVWAHRHKFKEETTNDYVMSNAPTIMPYLIIKCTDNKYYALLLSNNFKSSEFLFILSNKKYNSLNKTHYVRLSKIFELGQWDIVNRVNNIKVDKQDLEIILTKIMSLIITTKTLFTREEINILKKIYDEHNPINLGSIIEIKDNEQIKKYLIIKQKNNREAIGVNCIINPEVETNINNIELNFADFKTILNNQLPYLKLKNSLSLEEVQQVLNLREQYYNEQAIESKQALEKIHYEVGSIIRINNYDYVIVAENNKKYYVISYQNRNWDCSPEAIAKKYLNCEYITKMSNEELLKLLKKISNRYNSCVYDNYLEIRKEISKNVKRLEKIQNS